MRRGSSQVPRSSSAAATPDSLISSSDDIKILAPWDCVVALSKR
jgi:hypothetical protein